MARLKNTTINDTGSIILPVGNASQRINTDGSLRLNSNRNDIEIYNGTAWANASLDRTGIVQGGLVFSVDARLNESYDGSSTWKDLTGNQNATLTNSPTFNNQHGGYLNFNGSNQYGIAGALSGVTTTATVCAVVRRGADGWDGAVFGFGTQASNTQDVYFWGSDANRQFGFNTWNGDSWGFLNSTQNGNLMDGEWHHLTAVFNRSNIFRSKIYVDGVEMYLSQVRGTTLTRTVSSSFGIALNGWQTPNQLFNGDISAVQVYNRELTNEEIRNNFEAVASRYGIPTNKYGSFRNPGKSALDILRNNPNAPSGTYWIHNNRINNGEPLRVITDMLGYNGQDGGWTLVHSVVGANSNWNNTNVLLRRPTDPTRADDYSIIEYADTIHKGGSTWEFMIEADETEYTRYTHGGTYTASRNDSFKDSTPRTGSFGRNVDFTGIAYGNGQMYERVPWINQGGYGPYPSALFTTYPGTPNWWGTITEGGSATNYTTGPWLSSAMPRPDYKWVWVR